MAARCRPSCAMPRFPGDGVLRGSLFAITGLDIKGIAEPRFGG
ncbi:SMP-30/CGR1 family protein [Mesorhizobium sp. LNHC209A00]|nr:SMP-30/CGR1 family protein [Mesorhizobium sp. LNHC229A00]ESY99563.1 SMP-30/CGR1 family protein [Mesorhizobium sp. LNHC209A00]